MQKRKFVYLSMVLLAVFCFSSCEYDVIEVKQIVIPPDQEMSFSNDILPIFTSNCVDCHNGTTSPDLRSENAYNSLLSGDYLDTTDPENSDLYQKLQSGSHGARASSEEKQWILEWIKRGAKDN